MDAIGDLRSALHDGEASMAQAIALLLALPAPERRHWASYTQHLAHDLVWQPGGLAALAEASPHHDPYGVSLPRVEPWADVAGLERLGEPMHEAVIQIARWAWTEAAGPHRQRCVEVLTGEIGLSESMRALDELLAGHETAWPAVDARLHAIRAGVVAESRRFGHSLGNWLYIEHKIGALAILLGQLTRVQRRAPHWWVIDIGVQAARVATYSLHNVSPEEQMVMPAAAYPAWSLMLRRVDKLLAGSLLGYLARADELPARRAAELSVLQRLLRRVKR